jgi:hypothetical protein
MEFFKEGGFGMFPILFIGMVLVGAALRFAVRPDRSQVPFLGCITMATLIATVHATWTDFGTVCGALADSSKFPDAELTRVLLEGVKESTRPGAFGGGMLTIAFILFSVGAARLSRQGEPAT